MTDSNNTQQISIVLIKLTNGEDIICHIHKEDEQAIYVAYPISLIKSQEEEPDGEIYLVTRFAEFFIQGDLSLIIPIYKSHIMSVGSPDSDFKDYYIEYVQDIIAEQKAAKAEQEQTGNSPKVKQIIEQELQKRKDEGNESSQQKANVAERKTKVNKNFIDSLIQTEHADHVDENDQEKIDQTLLISSYLKEQNRLN